MAKPFAVLLLLVGMWGAELALFGLWWAGLAATAAWLGCAALLVAMHASEPTQERTPAPRTSARRAHALG